MSATNEAAKSRLILPLPDDPWCGALSQPLTVQVCFYSCGQVPSRTKRRSARALDESRVEEERHDRRLADRLAVEALDRQPLHAGALDVLDQGRESLAQPLVLRLAQRDERPAAALDEQRRFAAEEDDVGACDPRRASSGALRPGESGAVGLSRVGGGEHQRLLFLAVLGLELSQPLHGPAKRELGAAEPFDEVPAAAEPERLERPELAVDGAVTARDPFAADAVARDDALALEQELGERAPVGAAREQAAGQRPAALRRGDFACSAA